MEGNVNVLREENKGGVERGFCAEKKRIRKEVPENKYEPTGGNENSKLECDTYECTRVKIQNEKKNRPKGIKDKTGNRGCRTDFTRFILVGHSIDW